jgi:hypothetical protein
LLFKQYIFAQKQVEVIKAFQKGNIDIVNNNSIFPFSILNFGVDTIVNSNIEVRKKVISYCYNTIFKGSIKKGEISKLNNREYIMTIIHISKNGEFESESTLIFSFIKKKGCYKLCSIMLTG